TEPDICHLPPEHGPCRGLFYRYAYSPATGTCRLFLYGGCRGNANNFETLGESCTGGAEKRHPPCRLPSPFCAQRFWREAGTGGGAWRGRQHPVGARWVVTLVS
uniref:BPTI/Kunitz inhibitor domain-containing protein n=1 Tax=Anas platyrhynchos platyrhynchos TaxID=8840 RepID=A0A493SWA4_ANAPP